MPKIKKSEIKTIQSGGLSKPQSQINKPESAPQRNIDFSELLGQKITGTSSAHGQKIEALLHKFSEDTEKFKENQGLAELKAFRSSVQQVLQYILDHGVSLQHFTGRRRNNQLVEYEIVKINRELEQLSQAVLQKNKGIKLLTHIERIKGMLLTMVG